jgi:hypothetical protein
MLAARPVSKPDYADAFYARSVVRFAKGDVEGALQDFSEVIRLKAPARLCRRLLQPG